ncbi:MAG: hypothetical protein K1060chlam4_00442 [Candidatus Anoxychlamydiales bacterium]|nr:hypothetical protein [Candidatus Anoxychlamydiales bacterium]
MSLIPRIDSRNLQPAFKIIEEISSQLERTKAALEKLKSNPAILRISYKNLIEEMSSQLERTKAAFEKLKSNPTILRIKYKYRAEKTAEKTKDLVRKSNSIIEATNTIFLSRLICLKKYFKPEIAINAVGQAVITDLKNIENIDHNLVNEIEKANDLLKILIITQEKFKTNIKFLNYSLISLSAGIIFLGFIKAVNLLDEYNV